MWLTTIKVYNKSVMRIHARFVGWLVTVLFRSNAS